jgi:hypothetical protein
LTDPVIEKPNSSVVHSCRFDVPLPESDELDEAGVLNVESLIVEAKFG